MGGIPKNKIFTLLPLHSPRYLHYTSPVFQPNLSRYFCDTPKLFLRTYQVTFSILIALFSSTSHVFSHHAYFHYTRKLFLHTHQVIFSTLIALFSLYFSRFPTTLITLLPRYYWSPHFYHASHVFSPRLSHYLHHIFIFSAVIKLFSRFLSS